jgi:hypothetical protein
MKMSRAIQYMHHAYRARDAAYQSALNLTVPDANRKFKSRLRFVGRARFLGATLTVLSTSKNILGDYR